MSKLMMPAMAVAATMMLSPVPASAAKYIVTFTGILTGGYDNGVFGVLGTLAGDAFTASFDYDTSLGTQAGSTSMFNTLCGGATATTYGCPADVVPSPVNGSLTINDHTVYLPGSDYGLVQTGYSGGVRGGTLTAETDSGGGAYFLHADATEVSGLPISLTTALATTSDVSQFIFQYGPLSLTYGQAFSNPGTVQIVPSVPEPATWTMMLAGIGAIGFVMRRRTQFNISYA